MWQPINTAPKDGTEVLVAGRGIVWCGWYSLEFGAWCMTPKSVVIASLDGDSVLSHSPCLANPTHWAPLLPAPVPA